MAVIRPFKAIRPTRDKAHLVASRSVNLYKQRILNAKLEENPYTFMHVILPEFGSKITTKPNTTERFKLVKKNFEAFRKKGIFIQDKNDCLYIYRQLKDGYSYTGIIAGAAVDDYLNGVIKIHEQTLTKREEIFKNYLDVCGFNAEPVLLSYSDNNTVDKVLKRYTAERSEYEFTTADGVTHFLWIVAEKKDIAIICKAFEKIPAVYIADGHHRSASSALLAKDRRSKLKKYSGKEMFNYCMAFFISESQLNIYDFNRVVKDLNGLSAKEFLDQLREKFDVESKGKKCYRPKKLHNFSMYLEGEWYSLTAKKGSFNSKHPVGNLDAQILTDNILSPVLGIHDLKTDSRIEFVGGLQGMEGLQRKVDEGKMKVAFGLFPVKVDQLKQIADTNNIMPPKTTWIEPKLRSGLVIQSLD
ncbi:MAG TPA: DUF1015 domain-containing protein [Flavobacteriales bacterium]|nr:DUF1015 domain-containing protein [Flavobacteriales bacterium]HRE75940.1 DUF1015 domain-containing protein [Flavobacteriales bacterium]HRE98115.1 DUF1015 domain-containing protein [Flavobacteriales bacterium]HRJ35185.1 DUF1015 domain-containing protein [Flavobacteriales bacterium]HRJ39096.1 DUF1015 domain-containing protein [Flavobacteriales bacterium]